MKRAISMIMVLVLALSMCVVGASAVESDAISETSATVGNERASWGYVKIRYDPNGAWVKCTGSGYIICFGKIRAISEILSGLDHTDNLASSAHTVFIDFDFSIQQTHQASRCLAFTMDNLVLLIILKRKMVGKKLSLFFIQR